MNSSTQKQLQDFMSVFPEVLKLSMAKDSPFEKLVTMLNEMFDKYQITDAEKAKTISQCLSSLCSQLTTSSQQASLQLIKDAFANETEKFKPELLKRQKDEFDDKLRIKMAEFLKDMYSMTASGGLVVPERLSTEVFQKIERIYSQRAK